jgi:YegS/Rv2252/BmrU family lipid kinase
MLESCVKVIVNPMAGGRSAGKEWQRISRQLQKSGVSFDYEFTKGTGDAIEIAKRAADGGYQRLIAVGGDGTVNEVANGILRSTKSISTILGIVSAGTAHAFTLSLGIDKDPVNACSFLSGQGSASVDVGVVQCCSQGQNIKRFFVNEASVGFTAEVVDAWKSLPNRFGNSVNLVLRAVSGYKSLVAHRNKMVRLRVGNEIESIYICAVVVANGQYMANRMQIAPQASIDDGLLDAVIVGNLARFEMLKVRPTLYNGSHIRHAMIREKKTTTITIESDEQLLVEVDGELLGESPASFWVIPSALTVCCIA